MSLCVVWLLLFVVAVCILGESYVVVRCHVCGVVCVVCVRALSLSCCVCLCVCTCCGYVFVKRRWFSGKISRCHRDAPGSIPGRRIFLCPAQPRTPRLVSPAHSFTARAQRQILTNTLTNTLTHTHTDTKTQRQTILPTQHTIRHTTPQTKTPTSTNCSITVTQSHSRTRTQPLNMAVPQTAHTPPCHATTRTLRP